MVLKWLVTVCVVLCVTNYGVLGRVMLVDIPHMRTGRDTGDSTLTGDAGPIPHMRTGRDAITGDAGPIPHMRTGRDTGDSTLTVDAGPIPHIRTGRDAMTGDAGPIPHMRTGRDTGDSTRTGDAGPNPHIRTGRDAMTGDAGPIPHIRTGRDTGDSTLTGDAGPIPHIRTGRDTGDSTLTGDAGPIPHIRTGRDAMTGDAGSIPHMRTGRDTGDSTRTGDAGPIPHIRTGRDAMTGDTGPIPHIRTGRDTGDSTLTGDAGPLPHMRTERDTGDSTRTGDAGPIPYIRTVRDAMTGDAAPFPHMRTGRDTGYSTLTEDAGPIPHMRTGRDAMTGDAGLIPHIKTGRDTGDSTLIGDAGPIPHTRTERYIKDSTSSQGRPIMTSLRVESDIFYRYAKTSVASRLANRADVAQEISFNVVLPQSAFISAFHIELEGKVYHAYVKEKEEAHREYTQAVSQGRTAAKVDLSARDSNRFTVSVNVEAAAKVVFNLTYEELLTRRLGVYNHVINLDPGQIVPELSVIVRIDESNALSTIRVPTLRETNEISFSDEIPNDPFASIERPAPNKATIRWNPSAAEQRELKEEGVKGQLTVEYDVERTGNPSQILVSDGYFVHFYSPAELAPLRKHVVFVLDISGSMIGTKLAQLKEAMATILSDLQTGDYFSIILFASDVEIWLPSTKGTVKLNRGSKLVQRAETIVPVTQENIQLAKEFIANVEITGYTNIYGALMSSLDIVQLGRKVMKLAKSDRSVNPTLSPEPMIIFLTDGQPNVGQSDPSAIVRGVTQKNQRKTPIFSLAFGSDADKGFLKKLSLKNAAFSRLIYEASDAALQLRDFYRQVASPLLANVTFNYEPTQVVSDSLTQLHFNNLFQGAELVVSGKLEPNIEKLRGVLLAKSSTGKSRYGFPWPTVVTLPEPVNKTAPSFMEKLWAYLNIQQLLEKQEQEDGVNGTSKDKALQLALKYSFVTPLTSLVVVKPNETTRVDAEDAAAPIPIDDLSISYRSLNLYGLPSNLHYAPMMSPINDRAAMMSIPHVPVSVPQMALDLQFLKPHEPHDKFEAANLVRGPQVSSVQPRSNVLETSTTSTTQLPDQPLSLSDLSWLTKSTDYLWIKINGFFNGYAIGLNMPDSDNGPCNINTTTSISQGRCRHLPYCIVPDFQNDFQVYETSYFCAIGSFAGVCCPDNVRLSSTDTTKINGSIGTLDDGPLGLDADRPRPKPVACTWEDIKNGL